MNVLITAGPTREPIDPVRYLTNRSSGKMGYALATAFSRKDCQVLLISGPTALDVPDQVDFLPVESAAEMYEAVKDHIGQSEIAVFAAAVADYAPTLAATQKIKKTEDPLTLQLTKTKDILGSARSVFAFSGTLIGFAAETENLAENARQKLERKQCDLVIANDVSQSEIGFDSDDNRVLLVRPDGEEALPAANKQELSRTLVQSILALYLSGNS